MANGLLDNIHGAWSLNFRQGNSLDVAGNGGGSGTANLYPFTHEAGSTLSVAALFTGGLAKGWGTDTANRMSFADTVGKAFNPGDNDFTVMAWVKASRGVNHPYIAKWDSSIATNSCWLLWNRSTNLSHRFSISSDGTSEETVVEIANPDTTGAGAWQLVIAGYDSGNQEIFMSLDGATKITVAHTGGAFANAVVNLTPGWFQDVSMIMGGHDQDETAYWADRVLTNADCALIWNSGAGLRLADWDASVPTSHEDGSNIKSSMVSYWDLTEASSSNRVDFHAGSNDTVEVGPSAPINQGAGLEGVTASVAHADMTDNLNNTPNEYLEKTSPVGIDQGVGSFTVAGWVDFNANSGVQAAISRWTNVGDQEQFVVNLQSTPPRRWQFAISRDGSGGTSIGVEDSFDRYSLSGVPKVQRFICAWYDGTLDTINLQIGNGPINTVGSIAVVFAGSTESLKFGQNFNFGGNWALLGGVWSWGYWSRLLTQVEKNFLYHKGFGHLYADYPEVGAGPTVDENEAFVTIKKLLRK